MMWESNRGQSIEMYFDLNVPVELANSAYLKRLDELGWGAVAINYIFNGKPPRERCAYARNTAVKLKQYTRLTLVISDPQQNVGLTSNEITRSFDIIAVRPTTERTFQIACQSLDIDMISLDLSDRLPFNLKHGLVREAIQRGVLFELSYGPSISASISGGKRRNALSSVMHATRIVGRAKGLVVSSGLTSGEHGLRAPHCVRNWAEMVGIRPDGSKTCVVDSPLRVIKHAGDRKWSVKGVVINVSANVDTDFYKDYILNC